MIRKKIARPGFTFKILESGIGSELVGRGKKKNKRKERSVSTQQCTLNNQMSSESKTVQGLITQPYGDSLPTATACTTSDTAPQAKIPQDCLGKNYNLQTQSPPCLPHFLRRDGNNISSQVAHGDIKPNHLFTL